MASACLVGVPVERIVYGDLLERELWIAVTRHALTLDGVRRDNQAIANANQVARVLKRMFGGKRA